MVNINQLNGSGQILNIINKTLGKMGTGKELVTQDIYEAVNNHGEILQEKEVIESIFLKLQQIHQQMENMTWLNKHYKILHDFAQVCSKTLDEDILLNKAYEMVSQVMATDAFYIALYNEGDSHVHFEFIVDNGKFYPKERIEYGKNYASEVIKSREIIHMKKAPQSLVYGEAGVFGERDTSSCLFVPVIIDDHVRAVISAQSYSDFAYRTEHEELLQIIGTQVINSIETARLYEKIYKMSQTDELTGLKNHRAFHEDLSRLMKESEQEIILIMIDSDNLKKVNDNYGHDIGDLYLQVLANGIKSVCGPEIEGYRYAGDEFMILITTKLKYGVSDLHEKLRQYYRSYPIVVTNNQFHVSFSTGVATYPNHGKTVDLLKKAADKALYAAKKSGKNKLVLAENLDINKEKLKNHMYFI
jgi:diguanylate cyclase (GGDEF)-like protein